MHLFIWITTTLFGIGSAQAIPSVSSQPTASCSSTVRPSSALELIESLRSFFQNLTEDPSVTEDFKRFMEQVESTSEGESKLNLVSQYRGIVILRELSHLGYRVFLVKKNSSLKLRIETGINAGVSSTLSLSQVQSKAKGKVTNPVEALSSAGRVDWRAIQYRVELAVEKLSEQSLTLLPNYIIFEMHTPQIWDSQRRTAIPVRSSRKILSPLADEHNIVSVEVILDHLPLHQIGSIVFEFIQSVLRPQT